MIHVWKGNKVVLFIVNVNSGITIDVLPMVVAILEIFSFSKIPVQLTVIVLHVSLLTECVGGVMMLPIQLVWIQLVSFSVKDNGNLPNVHVTNRDRYH
jgi:hypothetical protein